MPKYNPNKTSISSTNDNPLSYRPITAKKTTKKLTDSIYRQIINYPQTLMKPILIFKPIKSSLWPSFTEIVKNLYSFLGIA